MHAQLAFLGNSGAGEILLVLLVALLLFGAKRLPALARSLGQALEEFRRAGRNLSRDLLNAEPPDPQKRVEPPDSDRPTPESRQG